MKDKISFWSIIYEPNIGGAEIAQHNLLKKLVPDYDIQVHCFLENFMSFKRNNVFSKDGVTITQNANPFENVLKSFIKEQKPKLITTMLIGSDKVVEICHENNIPVIFFAHGVFEDICGFSPMKCQDNVDTCEFSKCINYSKLEAHRKKYEKCKYIICNSEYTLSLFMRFFPEFESKYKILYPDFDYDIFDYDGEVKKEINALATNSHILKGREVITHLATKNSKMKFDYVGCYDKTMVGLFRKYKNIKPYLKVPHDEMPNFYKNASVTLLPTQLNESFSGSAVESILCGTPVIAMRKGNLQNIIIDGVNGHLMDNLSIDEWTSKIFEYSKMRVDKKVVDDLRNKLNKNLDITELKKIIEEC